MHPSGGLLKKYEVTSIKEIPYKSIAAWKNGVYIRGVKYTITDFKPISKKKIEMSLTEGKNREIRRLFAHTGLIMKKLTRISIGTLNLEGLPKGAYREMTAYEVKRLLKQAGT
jgi:23S rRNA pseudouridine2605 synthase